MTVNRAIVIFAGAVILFSLTMTHVSGQVDLSKPTWLWVSVFVGLNLFQSGFTGFCPLATVLRKVGLRDGDDCSAIANSN